MNPSSENLADLQPNWAQSLPREAFLEIVLTLRGALPRPVSDDPLDLARRDRAAMAAVGSLLPANAAEGRLAAQFVAADAWALDCLRLAEERRRDSEVSRRCKAQAMSLMRESKSALRVLLRLQAVRQKIEADAAAANRAEWVELAALGMMAEGLSGDANEAPAVFSTIPAFPVGGGNDFGKPVSVGGMKLRGMRHETKSRKMFSRILSAEGVSAILGQQEAVGTDLG